MPTTHFSLDSTVVSNMSSGSSTWDTSVCEMALDAYVEIDTEMNV